MHLQTVSKLGTRDRIVLRFLRNPGRCDPPHAFAALRALVETRGATVLNDGNDYASRDELCLLSLLAVCQREQPVVTFTIDSELRSALLACAVLLSDQGLWLSHANAVRLGTVAQAALVRDVKTVYRGLSLGIRRARAMRLGIGTRGAA